MEDISKINQTEPIQSDAPSLSSYDQRKQKRRKHFQQVKKHFDTLSKIVHETHKELEEKNSPFRICIYQEGEDIYIDIIAIDDSGKTSQVFTHGNISHADLENLVQQLKTGRGLILDADI